MGRSIFRRLYALPNQVCARIQFRFRGVPWPARMQVLGPIGVTRVGNGHLMIGPGATFIGSSLFNRAGVNHAPQIVCGDDASLTIGSNFGMSGGAVYCSERITIGNNVLLGANCQVFDTDFHPIHWKDRRANDKPKTSPIDIEDDVWLGAGVTVLKGVRVGARSVVAAGSVITRDIPPDHIAGGIPAKVLRTIDGDSQ